MDFFETARKAGAEAYGARRAEQYGKWAKAAVVAKGLAFLAFMVFLFVMYKIGSGEA